MVFSSTIFMFLFFPLVFLVYYNPLVRNRAFRNVVLLVASLGFYAWGEPLFVFLMMISIVIGWAVGLGIERFRRKKLLLTLGIAFHVGLLFVFKYLSFLSGEFAWMFPARWANMDIPLPIGISFFSFQLMSYLFDVYYRKAKAQKNVLYVGLYIALFPQLIAGPIVRYETVADEIRNRRESKADIAEGMERFIYGLGKKVLLSNYLAQIADNVFFLPSQSVLTAWLGAIAYTLQIYYDFSGYSDMAIGLGRMFGFHFNENFRYPYTAGSVTDFWRRWHISLSSWFRDYVYIPMGGNRVKRSRWIFNLLTVWTLTGIWHGANWTFLIWGLFYFVLLLLEKLLGFAEKTGIVSRIYTLTAVVTAWVMFRADNVASGFRQIGIMFGFHAGGLSDAAFYNYVRNGWSVLLAAVLLSAPVYPWLRKRLSGHERGLECAEACLLFGIFVFSMFNVVSSDYNPFIYFNF